MKNRKNKYILISKDLQKNLIDFLDEVQLEAAKLNTTDNMHIVNFCSFAIEPFIDHNVENDESILKALSAIFKAFI